jgi:ATP adenylyltransferase
LTKKPRTAGSKKRTPAFTDDSEDFKLGSFGLRHKLILNKYCAVRPQLVLHTVEFEPQDELLNDHDFHAAWLALTALGVQYTVIFNGGKDAGASLNHKHMQLIPRSGHAGLESLLKSSGDDTKGAWACMERERVFLY